MMASFNFSRALIDKRHVRRIALGASVIIAARPKLFKAFHFSFVELLSGAVKLLQLIAQSHHFSVQTDRLFIRQESLRLITCGADLRVCSDG